MVSSDTSSPANVLTVNLLIMKLLLYLVLLQNTCIFVRAVNNAGNVNMTDTR